ncbi:MAG: hypothetical protein GY737_26790 [Desulfobacteraceae bacterium]|nr:hypothetical protein [Desulfobacteraceae bacterium]
MKTREARNILDSTVTDFFDKWAEKGEIQSEFAKHAKRIFQRRLAQLEDRHNDQELMDLLQSPDVMEYIGKKLPESMNSMVEIVHLMAVSLVTYPEEKQLEFINDIFASLNADKIAGILTSLARTIDTLHKNNPTIIADNLVSILRDFLENIDLGEIKSLSENSKKELRSLITQTNDLLFEFPAKLILVLSFIPGISNNLLFFLKDLLKRFNALPADILTDLLISFFKEVDGKTVGKLINNLAEFIRQVHTGSALIGDPGSPRFSTEFARKTGTILNEVNPELVFKAGNALVDGKEALLKSMYDAAWEDPQFAELALKQLMAVRNSRNRLAQRKIELLDELGEEEAAGAIATASSEWNADEFAELINSGCSLANRLHDHSPDLLKNRVEEFVDTLDLYEIEETVAWVSRDLTETFKPVLQTVVPVVAKDLIECLASGNNGNEEQITAMRKTLRRFIMDEEIC